MFSCENSKKFQFIEGDQKICPPPSTIYGFSKNPTKTAFFEFLENSKKGLDINVQDKYGPKRDNLYIKDAIKGILFASAFGESSEVYNISSGGKLNNFLSVAEIALLIAKVTNNKIHKKNLVNVNFFNETFKEPRGYILDNSKLCSLGWKLDYSYQDAIEEIIV